MPDAKAEDHSDTLLADRVIQAGRLSALVGLACESVAVAVELRAVGRVIGRDVVATVSVGLLQFLYGGSANTAGAVASARTTMSDDVTANTIEALVSRLRRRLETIEAKVSIHTLRGIGYLLKE